MSENIAFTLPYDSSGYGEIACKFVALSLIVQFHYTDEIGNTRIGEIKFNLCTFLRMNGTLKDYDDMGYDTIYTVESDIGLNNKQKRYKFMLSGSDFQFELIAENFSFEENSKRMIE